MQQPSAKADHTPDLEMSLRDHLLARRAGAPANAPSTLPYPPPPTTSGPEHPYQAAGAADSPGQPEDAAMNVIDYSLHDVNDPRKGKRELSTSKRAAQNRAAQRAFRQRKEGYIKKLEKQVDEFQSMEQSYRTLQNENYQLREYILSLQSRLLESQSDVPPAPAHISLGHTGSASQSASNDDPDSHANHLRILRRELLSHIDGKSSDRDENGEGRPAQADGSSTAPHPARSGETEPATAPARSTA